MATITTMGYPRNHKSCHLNHLQSNFITAIVMPIRGKSNFKITLYFQPVIILFYTNFLFHLSNENVPCIQFKTSGG
jgi:hypothetical protein